MAERTHRPTAARIKHLLERLGPDVFDQRVQRALDKLEQVEAVEKLLASGYSVNRATHEAGVSRSSYRYYAKLLSEREGERWERLLDLRAPAKPWTIPTSWRSSVEAARRANPALSFDQLRDLMGEQFGERARISDGSIGRILRAAGLSAAKRGMAAVSDDAGVKASVAEDEPPGDEDVNTEVEELSGGGGLALVLAAAAESGAISAMADALETVAAELPEKPQDVPAEPPGRDELGRLTAEYNQSRLAHVEEDAPDPRFRSVEQTREDKDLSRLTFRRMRREKLEDRLLVFAATPLLTERRGFAGFDGPSGSHSRALSQVAYKAATIDKFARELKYAQADGALWESYLSHWLEWDRRWSSGHGLRKYVAYLDGSQDPWWTKAYARSGKVARLGRVMPCMSRLLISGGAGVPLWVETYSGQASIKAEIRGLLQRADALLGEGELGRLLVVDAELVSVELFEALVEREHRHFITVLKGSVLKNLEFHPGGPAVPFRQRDTLREGRVLLRRRSRSGAEAPGFGGTTDTKREAGRAPYETRVVEMVRPDSRHPTPTYFATSAPIDMLTTIGVAETYLARWPLNEGIFRSGRNGVGLQRSHGYGRQNVQNVALLTRREIVQSRCSRTEQARAKALRRVEELRTELELGRRHLVELKRKLTKAVYVQSAERKADAQAKHVEQLRAILRYATKDAREAERAAAKAKQEKARIDSTPTTIASRDVTLDSIATCLKLTLHSLLMFIMKEYFGVSMEPRTFIEEFVGLPVTIVKTDTDLRYAIQANLRSPKADGRTPEGM